MKRKWVICPYCRNEQKTNNYSAGAVCKGVWCKCKNCKKEFEIVIKSGN